MITEKHQRIIDELEKMQAEATDRLDHNLLSDTLAMIDELLEYKYMYESCAE